MNKSKNKNRKIFNLFSLFDIFVILAVVVVFVIVYFAMNGGAEKKENQKLEFSVKVENVEKSITEAVKIGDVLYNADTNDLVGKVKHLTVDNSYIYAYNNNLKKYEKATISDKFDMILKIEADVSSQDANLFIGNFDVKVGKKINLEVKGYYLSALVYSIER